MNEPAETNDVLVDAYSFELREGDRVRLVFADDTWGTVEKIQTPKVSMREGDTVEAVVPPCVHLRLDSGEHVAFEGEFMRTVVWRWNVNEVRR